MQPVRRQVRFRGQIREPQGGRQLRAGLVGCHGPGEEFPRFRSAVLRAPLRPQVLQPAQPQRQDGLLHQVPRGFCGLRL